MKREKIVTADSDTNTALYNAGEVIRKFKFALAGTPEKNLKAYRAAKKTVAQLLGNSSASRMPMSK